MATTPIYYSNTQEPVDLANFSTFAFAVEEAVNAILKSNVLPVGNKIEIAYRLIPEGQIISASADITINEARNQVTIGGELVDISAGLVASQLGAAAALGLGLAAGTVVFGGVQIIVGSAIYWTYSNYFETPINDFFDTLTGTLPADCQLLDSYGSHIGGALYENGYAGSGERTAVRRLVLRKGDSINNGYEVNVLTGNGRNLTGTYSIANGSVIDAIETTLGYTRGGTVNVYGAGSKLNQSDLEVTTASGAKFTVSNVSDIFHVSGVGPNGETVGFKLNQIMAGGRTFAKTFDASASNLIIGVDGTVNAGGGNDYMIGGAGLDHLYGGSGNDYIWADSRLTNASGTSPDKLYGGSGNDHLYGNAGNNRFLSGGDGDDYIEGGAGQDGLMGGLGKDYLDGGADDDRLFGGAGADELDGGAGTDTAFYTSSSSGVKVDLSTGRGYGGDAQGDTLTDIEIVRGSNAGDTLISGSGTTALFGGGGADVLRGNAGGVTLDGGAGNDRFYASSGNTISNIESGDVAFVGGSQLRGGSREEGTTGPYVGASGETYTLSGSTLSVNSGGQTVTIQGFSNSEAGIFLQEVPKEEEVPPPPGPGPGPGPGGPGGGGDGGGSGYGYGFGGDGEPYGPPPPPPDGHRDPLVLDLNGDGVNLIAQTVSHAYFDLDQDGFAERTGWVSRADGMLVMDANGDGVINDISELVGSGFVSPSASTDPLNDGPTGFAELATFDSNGDGVVDAGDSAWAQLQVWRDLDGDGVTDAGELQGLDATGIASIGLQATDLVANPQTALDSAAPGENVITQEGTFTRTDGTTGTVGDVWLSYNPMDTRFNGAVEIDWDVVSLPFLMGTGELKNSLYAMSEDPLLKEMGQDLMATTAADAHLLASKVEVFILRWAGADGVGAQSRGSYTNGAYMAVMEKVMGFEFLQIGVYSDPYPVAGSVMMGNFKQLQAAVMRQILPQIPLGQDLLPELSPGYATQASLDVGTSLAPMLARMTLSVPTDGAAQVQYWNTMTMLVHSVKDQLPETDAQIEAAFTAKLDAQGLGLTYDQVRSAFIGGAGDDVVVGTTDGTGSEVFAVSRDNVLFGGAGDDLLQGSSGEDVYLFGYGSGHDEIREPVSGIVHADRVFHNTVKFLPGVTAADVVYHTAQGATGTDLVIELVSTGETLTIKDQFNPRQVIVSNFEFSNGTTTNIAEIAEHLMPASDGADVMYGLPGHDSVLNGGQGNDQLLGQSGNDTINGGAGNDLLDGGGGNDTYLFGSGGGWDTISNYWGNNTVRFGDGITAAQLELSRGWDANDLVIRIAGTNDKLTIHRQFSGWEVGTFEFADGSALTWQDIEARMVAESSTAGDDVALGFGGNEVYSASAGNDLMNGGGGNDTYEFGIGSGQDMITDAWGSNIVRFGAGVTAAQLDLSRGWDINNLVIRIAGTDDKLTIERQFSGWKMSTFEFADGTALTWQDITARMVAEAKTAGDDVVSGLGGNDIIDGGAGNDLLSNGDIYAFGIGSGKDKITDPWGYDTVQFGAGITAAQLELSRGWSVNDLVIRIAGTNDKLTIERQFSGWKMDTFAFADGTTLTWQEVQALTDASVGPNLINGTNGTDTLSGTAGRDKIEGLAGNDTLNGGVGDDRLEGGSGNDTYVFDAGFGDDEIVENWGTDTVRFGAGISAADVSLSRVGTNRSLQIDVAGTGDRLTVMDHFAYGARVIERFEFADGTVWTAADVSLTVLNQSMTAGHDLVQGYGTADTLTGGTGDDRLQGDSGNDTYAFDAGFGDDQIYENWGTDTVRFGAGISAADVTLSRVGANRSLQIDVAGTGDRLTVVDHFAYGARVIERFEFADGTVWTAADVSLTVLNQSMTAGHDLVLGYGTADTLEGGAGDDRLQGDSGNDTYVFDAGFGDDEIYENWGADTVRFGASISAGDVTLSRVGANRDLQIDVAGTGDRLTVVDHFAYGGRVIERFEFADGTAWTPTDVLQIIATQPVDTASNSFWGAQATGAAGDDALAGDAGNNLIDGGAGNDVMAGGLGNDTYVFDRGYAEDTVQDTGGDDSIYFGGQIDLSALDFARTGINGEDLLISVGGVERLTLEVKGQFGDVANRVDTFTFEDGTTINWNDIQDQLLLRKSTWGDDTIVGFGTDDTLDGDRGNDTLTGGAGNDTIIGGKGRDSAVFSGLASDYEIQVNGDVTTVRDLRPGGDGIDTLYGVEDLVFNGQGTPQTVNVKPLNQAPTAADDIAEVVQNGAVEISLATVLANDADPEGGALNLTEIANVTGGRAWINLDGNINFEAASNFSGNASIDYVISDPDGGTATATINVNVVGGNSDPVAVDDSLSASEDAVLLISPADLATNDLDADGDTLSITSIDITNTLGSVSANGDGTFSYDPGAAYQGLAVGETAADTFAYTVSDGNGGAPSTATVTITVTGTNDGPVAVADTGATNEDTLVTLDVLANDTDVDLSDTHTVDAVTVASGLGTATIVNNRVVFNPTAYQYLAQGETAQVVLNYTMSDTFGAASSSTATITVTGTNDALVAVADVGATNEDTLVTLDVLANDTDVDLSDTHTVDAVMVASGLGTASIVGNQVVFNPAAYQYLAQGETAQVVLNYTMSDNSGAASSSTATITVTGTNDTPVTVADTGATNEDTLVTLDVLANDTDVDLSDTHTVDAVTVASGLGTASIVGNQVVFNPTAYQNLAQGETAQVVLNYTMSDNFGAASRSTVAITVTGTNDAPVAVADLALTHEDGAIIIKATDLLANDRDIDASDVLSIASLDTTATNGTVVDNADGTFSYDPSAAFQYLGLGEVATDTFAYTVSDGHGGTSTATVFVTVKGTNDLPVAVADNISTGEDTAVTFTAAALLVNDSDVDANDVLSILSMNTASTQGSVVDNGDGSFSYDPGQAFQYLAEGETANDTFTYTVSDGSGGTAKTTVSMLVTGTNDVPVAQADSLTASEDAAVTFSAADLSANDSDLDASDVLSITAIDAAGAQGTVVDNGDATFTYDPGAAFQYLAKGETATDTFTYTIGDGHGGSATATVTMTITGANDGPVAVADDLGSVDAYSEILITASQLLANDSDIDASDILSIVSVGNAINGQVVMTATGEIFFQPDLGYAGTATFDYTVSDGNGGTATATASAQSILPTNLILGAAGKDKLKGDKGPNVIDGLAGNDKLKGKDGADILVGGAGDDEMSGGKGDDTFLVSGSGNGVDELEGGKGFDRILGSIGDDVIGMEEFEDENSIELIDGGLGFNTIQGTAEDDELDFSATVLNNIDLIDGGAGDDEITGSAGNDTIMGGAGNDELDGGAGNDTFLVDGQMGGFDEIKGGAGFDTILGSAGNDVIGLKEFEDDNSVELIDGGQGFNVIQGSDHGDELDFSQTTLTNIGLIDGGAGDDEITGSVGHDMISGGADDDEIDGGAGTDTAVFSGNFADYEIKTGKNGKIEVRGPDGKDKLINVERLQFADQTVYLVPNVAPIARDDTASTLEDTSVTISTASLLANDSDGDALTLTGVANALGGTVSLDANGDAVFIPDLNFSGNATFDYTISDGHGGTSMATVTVVVAAVADAPVLTTAAALGNEDTAIALEIASQLTDIDGSESLELTIQGVPVGATLSAGTQNLDGSWSLLLGDLVGLTITPSLDYSGAFDLTVTATATEASNGNAASTVATLTVSVNAVADVPVLTTAAALGNEDTAIALDIASQLTALDGSESLGLTIQGVPAGASLSAGTQNLDGSWSVLSGDLVGLTLTPALDYFGGFNLTVTATATEASNGNAAATVATLSVSIDAVADAPDLMTTAALGNEDTAIVLDIASQLADIGGSKSLGLTIQGVPAGASLSVGTFNADGSWSLLPGDLAGLSVTPPLNFFGAFDLIVTATATEVSNGDAARVTDVFTVSVAPVNDAPVAVADSLLGVKGESMTILAPDLLANDTDAEGGALHIVAVASGTGGTAQLDVNGDVTFTPDAGFLGNATFDYSVSDGQLGMTRTTVTVEVLPRDVLLLGGVGADTLTGGAGNDTITGLAGNDVLTGGAGNDTYVLGRGDGLDTINNIGEGGSADKVSYTAGVNRDQLWFTHSGNDLVIQVIGATDQVSITDWYGGTVNQVASIETADGSYLTNALVENLVTAMAGMVPPPVGQTNLTAAERTQLDPIIAANWL